MKKTRRFAAMVAAMALATTMVAPTMMNASAEDEAGIPVTVVRNGSTPNEVTTITPDADNAKHTYTAYQILQGTWTLKEGKTTGSTNDNDYELKVTDLGTAANTLLSDNAFKAFKADDDFGKSIGDVISALGNDATDPQKAAALAQFLSDVQTNTPKAEELAEIIGNALKGTNGTEIGNDTTLAEGYYLVTDSYTPNADSPTNNNKPDAVSKFILKVNGTINSDGITIIPKKSYPEVIKKVQENVKNTTDYTGEKTALQTAATTGEKWNDVADYNIGDDVPFRLCGSMPETLADYDAYYYKFTDTLDTQFDQPKTVTVTVGTNEPLIFTLNEAGTAYELPEEKYLKKNETAISAVTHKELVATSKFMEQINEALVDVEGWATMTDQEKLTYVRTNWNSLTRVAAEGIEEGVLVAKGYTADKDVDDYIKEKTIIDTPAVPVRGEDTTTDGNCRVTWDSTNHKLLVSFENVKAYAGVTKDTIVTVEYNAKLNATADIGLDGQENKVDLTYSHNPNTDYNPVTNDDKPEAPTDEQGTDTTPEDKVIVFTYEVDINKIDADTKQNLEGAEFTLKNSSDAVIRFTDNGDGTYTVADQTLTDNVTTTIKSDANGLFKLVGLDDGTYTLTETKAPEGYPTPSGDAANFALVLTANTVNNQAWDGTPETALVINDEWVDEENESLNIALKGTLDGELMDNLGSANNLTPNKNTRGKNGGVKGVIQNSKSTTLPSTGGMGTKLFIAGGGITATLAAVYLVSKKRSRKEEE
ncbi:MAG: isopeptide-forming domain-containing fimbrial protein [Ruminococcus sp.]|nr:isopeptide-forming domain-containing fimbrial protein [Ruminococcus sp.]